MNKKRVLITGASRGIGEAIAKKLAKEGYDLFLVCSSSMDRLNIIKNEIADSYHVDCQILKCDVSSYDEVKECAREVLRFDDLYAVINNAAISYIGLMTDMSVDEWKKIMDVNLNSIFYFSHELAPYMVNNKEGKIINISSMWGQVGASMEVAYSTAKGGVDAFTKALAKELAPSNVQVNAVSFGVIDTDMNKCFSKEEMDALVMEIPSDRLGTVEEASEMVLKILESPKYLTGQIIRMDGGLI